MTTMQDDRDPQATSEAREKASRTFAQYIAAEMELTSETVLDEPVVLHDHAVVERDAQKERALRVQALSADSAASFYPLADNHAQIDTLLTEMGY